LTVKRTSRARSLLEFYFGSQTKVSAVFGNKALLIGWGVLFGVDRADRASWDASAAINALVGVNEELIVTFVDALDWANLDAGAVFGSDAGLSDDVSHGISSLFTAVSLTDSRADSWAFRPEWVQYGKHFRLRQAQGFLFL
jgi:hypothetical protein